MRKNTLLLLIAASMLTGCALGAQPTPPPKPKRIAPASLTQDCGDLPQPPTGLTQDLLANHVKVAKKYHLCRGHHADLANWLEANDD